MGYASRERGHVSLSQKKIVCSGRFFCVECMWSLSLHILSTSQFASPVWKGPICLCLKKTKCVVAVFSAYNVCAYFLSTYFLPATFSCSKSSHMQPIVEEVAQNLEIISKNYSTKYSQSHLGWYFRKLKAQSSRVSFATFQWKETFELSFELWNSIRKCHSK